MAALKKRSLGKLLLHLASRCEAVVLRVEGSKVHPARPFFFAHVWERSMVCWRMMKIRHLNNGLAKKSTHTTLSGSLLLGCA